MSAPAEAEIGFAAAPQVVDQGRGRVSVEWIARNDGLSVVPAGTVTDVVEVNDRLIKLTLHQDLAPGGSYTSAFPIAPLLKLGSNTVSIELGGTAPRGDHTVWAAIVQLAADGTIAVSP